MLKATLVTTEDDAYNLFCWLANFTPFTELADVYAQSRRLPIPDILVVGYNHWTTTDPYYHNEGGSQLALVDEESNVIFNLGMISEHKMLPSVLSSKPGVKIGNPFSLAASTHDCSLGIWNHWLMSGWSSKAYMVKIKK